ncbi:hypothetical protein [Sphingomonas abietis]|uniref:Lipoprotein n=1 Tax=Sphingomonas abietis TaxID=3012344 RepID=A0ABY7NP27_9SPHN|nr:hypothetical protein [Sphingomonas abietis]WBO23289.1 hypothetical protein PBT88_03895 [Sphingomonas abietis]
MIRGCSTTTLAALGALSLLAGCQKAKPAANSLDAMDAQLVNGAVVAETPANKALAAAIQVDPAKAGRHQPGDRAAPVSLAQIADRQRHGQPAMPAVTEAGGPDGAELASTGGTGCLGGLAYSNDWAAQLPADLPMHPSARLQEAAGHDGGCAARVVSFTVAGDRGQVLGWYAAKAKAAGYSVGRDDKGGDWNLAGDKGDSAYYIIIGPPVGGETPVDYIWTHGG